MISSSTNPGLRTLAALITLDFQDYYLNYGASQPPRTGLHASSLLVPESEWCTRRYVLSELHSQEAVTPELARWQWKQQAVFENGWDVHKRWQKLFRRFGNVVYSNSQNNHSEIAMVMPELDLTHCDEDRQVYFSPDAILDIHGEHMVVEIKGINHDAYQSLPDDLEGARDACETVNRAVIQCNLYLHLLQLNHGIILIENKNNQDFRLWIIEYTRALALPYVQRAYQVKGAIIRAHKGQLAARVCQSPESPLARRCPLAGVCFREGIERDEQKI